MVGLDLIFLERAWESLETMKVMTSTDTEVGQDNFRYVAYFVYNSRKHFIFLKEEQPNAPPRKHRSLKSLTQSENESTLMEESGQPPRRPSRRSNSNTSSLSKFSAIPDSQGVQPCVEEPCVQDIRDYMGYAIVDKRKQREPPLPPPRTPPPRKKRDVS